MILTLVSDDISLKHPVGVLRELWLAKRRMDSRFFRCDFSPMDCPAVLPWIMVLTIQRAGGTAVYEYKLVGEGVAQLVGTNLVGTKVGDKIPGKIARIFLDELQSSAEKREPSFSRLRVPTKGRDYIEVLKGLFPVWEADDILPSSFFVVIARPEQRCY